VTKDHNRFLVIIVSMLQTMKHKLPKPTSCWLSLGQGNNNNYNYTDFSNDAAFQCYFIT